MPSGGLLIGLIVLGVIVVLLALWVIATYNRLKSMQIAAVGAWADVDVQLKRRYDLIPNLVNTVKGYAAHEKDTLERVISARNKAVGATSQHETIEANNMLTAALGRLFAVAEAYPDLKANQNFMHLQEELTSTENKIGFARQNFNRNAGQLNEAIVMFPTNVVANVFNIKLEEFYELEDTVQREAPKVQF